MGNQIIKQPDGRLAVFSTFTDTFVLMDATPDEIVQWFGERAAETERDRTRTVLAHVLADNPRAAYFQFAHTWDEACKLNHDHGGDLRPDEGEEDELGEEHDFQWDADQVQRCTKCTLPHAHWAGGPCPGSDHPLRPGEYV